MSPISQLAKKVVSPWEGLHVNEIVDEFVVKAPVRTSKVTTPFNKAFPILNDIYNLYPKITKTGEIKFVKKL